MGGRFRGKGPFGTMWMDLEDITLNEVSPTKKEKYRMILLTCGV